MASSVRNKVRGERIVDGAGPSEPLTLRQLLDLGDLDAVEFGRSAMLSIAGSTSMVQMPSYHIKLANKKRLSVYASSAGSGTMAMRTNFFIPTSRLGEITDCFDKRVANLKTTITSEKQKGIHESATEMTLEIVPNRIRGRGGIDIRLDVVQLQMEVHYIPKENDEQYCTIAFRSAKAVLENLVFAVADKLANSKLDVVPAEPANVLQ